MHARYPDQVGGDNLEIHSVYPGVLVGQVATRWRVIEGVNEATQSQWLKVVTEDTQPQG